MNNWFAILVISIFWIKGDILAENYNRIIFLTNQTGIVMGNNVLYRTVNGGKYWKKVYNYFRDGINDINSPNGQMVFACGFTSSGNDAYGAIYKSRDRGNSWEIVGYADNPNHIAFLDTQIGYISEHQWNNYTGENYYKISKSIDGGNNWQRIYRSENFLLKFSFVNSDIGFALDSTLLVRTIDGGVKWDTLLTNVPLERSFIYFLNESTGLIGFKGKLLKTSDGGQNWNEINLPVNTQFLSHFFSNDNTGYLFGNSTRIVKTTDSGETWTLLPIDAPHNINSVYFSTIDTGYAVGNSNLYYRTNDGGNTWVLDTLILNEPPRIVSISHAEAIVEQLFEYQVEVQDPDDTTFVFSLSGQPNWLSIDKNTGLISGTPPPIDTAFVQISFNIVVEDQKNGEAILPFTLIIRNILTPPILTSKPPILAFVGETYRYQSTAEDDDLPLRFLVTGPNWLHMEHQTGLLEGTPTITDIGIYHIK